tara:strand:+ start:517 stop:693 length:177 start_codon:yes stop_codon:yes gene_type:complete
MMDDEFKLKPIKKDNGQHQKRYISPEARQVMKKLLKEKRKGESLAKTFSRLKDDKLKK